MNPEFIIRIIVRARNEIAGVLQAAAGDVDKLTKAHEKGTDVEKRRAAQTKKTADAMEDAKKRYAAYTSEVERGTKSGEQAIKQLQAFGREFDRLGNRAKAGSSTAEQMYELGKSARTASEEIKVASREQAKASNDITRIEAQNIQKRVADQQRLRGEISKSVRAAQNARTQAERDAANSRMSTAAGKLRDLGTPEGDIRKVMRDAFVDNDVDRAITKRQVRIRQLSESIRDIPEPKPRSWWSRFFDIDPGKLDSINDRIRQFEHHANNGSFSASRFAGNLRAIVIVGAIAFFQQLVGVGIALGGTLVSVASSAIQAGAALGGALASGAAQAIPVLGLLAAAWGRVGAVFDAVKQAQKARQAAAFDAATQADKERGAADAVRSANEALANAQRQALVAQENLTKARADAVRQIQDLVNAERQAQLQAESARLAQQDAQASLRKSLAAGNVDDLAQQSLQARQSNLDVVTTGISAARATFDARKAVRGGVEGMDNVVQARRAIADAARAIADARHNLAGANEQASETVKQMGTADRLLQQMLGQLSPAERRLYNALERLTKDYKKVFTGKGGILESIIDSFTFGAKRLNSLLRDNGLVRAAKQLADAIGVQLRRAFSFGTGSGQVGFIRTMAKEAERNLPTVVTLVMRVIRIFENFARAGRGAFRNFLGFLNDAAGSADKATSSGSGFKKLEHFLSQGEKYTESWLRLGAALARLFLAVIGQSAGEGNKAIEDLTANINKATAWINDHQEDVRNFFAEARRATSAIMGTVWELTKALFSLFDEGQVEALAQAINMTLIPALKIVLSVTGAIARVFLEFAGTKIGSTLLTFFGAMAGIKLLVMPLVAGIGRLVTLMGVLGGSARVVAVGLRLLSVATGPVGLAIAGIITAILLLDQKFHFLGPTIRWLGTAFKDVFGWLKTHWPLVLTIVTGPLGLMVTLVVKRWKEISHAITSSVRWITNAVGDAASFIYRAFKKLGSDVMSILPGPLRKAGSSAARGFVEGIKEIGEFFAGIGKWLFRHVIKPIYDFFEIKSPSRLFMRIGGALVDGLREGLNSGIHALGGFLAGLGKRVIRAIVSGIKDAAGAVSGAIKDVIGDGGDVKKINPVRLPSFQRGQQTPVPKDAPSDAESQREFSRRWSAFWNGIVRVARRSTNEVEKQIRDMRTNSATSADRMYRDIRGSLADIQHSFETRTRKMVDAWDQAFQDIQKITYSGLRYMGHQTNSALKTLGGKTLDFGLKPPTVEKTERKAGGGFVGQQGERGGDRVHALLGRGEAVLNWAHQRIVDPALQAMYGFGLSGLFGRVSAQHASERAGGYARGGYVQDAAAHGGGAHLTAAARAFANRMFARGFSVTSAYRPGAVTSSGRPSQHGTGSALDFGNSVNNLNRLWSIVFPLRAQFNQLLGPKGLYNGAQRFFDPGLQADHNDHIHIGFAGAVRGAINALGNAASTAAVEVKKLVAPKVPGSGPLSKIAQRMIDRAYKAANSRIMKVAGSTDSGIDAGGSLAGGIMKIARHAAYVNRVKWDADIVKVLLRKESGGGKNLPPHNYGGGLDPAGPFQVISSTFRSFMRQGHTNRMNPYDNALAAFAYIKSRYGSLQNLASRTGLFGGNYKGYASGGAVKGPGSGTSDSVWARVSNGEHIWTAREVAAAGGHAAVRALRQLFGGGGQGMGGRFAKGGAVSGYVEPTIHGTDTQGILTELAAAQRIISSLAGQVVNSKFTDQLSKAFKAVIGDGGLLDQLDQAVQRLGERLAANLKAATYKVDKSGNIIKKLTDTEVADRAAKDLRTVYVNLLAEQTQIQASLDDVAKKLKKGGLSQSERAYLIGIQRNLTTRMRAVQSSIADNLESQYQAVEQQIQARTEAANNRASSATARLDLVQRARDVLGGTFLSAIGAPSNQAVGQQRADVLNAQASELQKAADLARKRGHGDTANQIQQQINELRQSAWEAVRDGLSKDVEEISRQAGRRSAALDIRGRVAQALGRVGDLAGIAQDRINSTQQQISELTSKQAEASAKGFYDLAETIGDQIGDLQASITEITAQQLQDSIDQVNRTATRRGSQLDLQDRLATLQQAAGDAAGAFAARGATLAARGQLLVGQRAELANLLGLALAQGNQGAVESLTDQIAELDVSIQENSAAVQSNTVQARQAAIDSITNRGGFLGNVYSGISGIITTLGQISGTTDTAKLQSLLQQQGTTLRQTGSGLIGQLLSGYGVNLTGMSPAQIAQSLSSLNYDQIQSGMTVEQQQQFQALIQAIIENTGAQLSNTQQLQQLTQPNTQSWSTTAWQWFRNAIFDGAGGLLPRYQNAALGITSSMPGTAPTAATASMAASNGMNSGTDIFAPVINNEEKTVDMDADTLANRLYFRYRNRPKS